MKRTTLALLATAALMAATAAAQESRGTETRSVEIRFTETAPRIDGSIEDLWLSADSAHGFTQHSPYENAEPTEPTTVFLLQDDENLYAAFRCYNLKNPPIACFTKDEDYVTLKIDPFDNKTSGYFFLVFGSGLYWDGLVLDDGQSQDMTWEGVWYQSVKLYNDRMEVEMKIPYKSIRYKKGLESWGIQFARHHARNTEDDFWIPVPQRENDLVSRWGKATGIDPKSKGYYFELYPEGFLRYDNFRDEEAEAKPKGSLSLKWDLTPQTTFNATAYPDFAQIESDPYSLNLSRYPTYLQEQRPFFVDGSDVFRFSTLNDTPFQALNIFYSRMIGRSVNGEAVPIMGGAKLTHKTRDWSMGLLAAYTDEFDDSVHIGGYKYKVFEPRRSFGAFRLSKRLLRSSQVGILASGTMINSDTFNVAAGIDAVYRKGPNQFITQAALSDRNNSKGWAVTSGFKAFTGPLLTNAVVEAIDDSFDVSDIGYVPWVGRRRASVTSGPFWTYRSGALRNLYLAASLSGEKSPGSRDWSRAGSIIVNPIFRNNWGSYLEFGAGKMYEADTNYAGRYFSFNFWGMLMGNNINGGCNYSYSYNYQRGYPAYQGSNWLNYNYSIVSPLSVGASSNLWIEWSQNNHIIDMYPRLRPNFIWRISAAMTLTGFDEMVMFTPRTEVSRTTLSTNRLGLLYSWNFRPKSWIYVAFNDYSGQEPMLDDNFLPVDYVMKPQYTIGAVKVRYLLYF